MRHKITIEGGFHNAAPITFMGDREIITQDDLIAEIEDLQIHRPATFRRLENHFCGISGCTCGGPRRADIVD